MESTTIHPKVWLKQEPWSIDSPYQYNPETETDPWSKCSQLVKDFDSQMCSSWKDEVSNLLIVAGLFSAVSTAFAVETTRLLKEEPETTSALILLRISAQLETFSSANVTNLPPTTLEEFSIPSQAIRINALIFISIVLNLMAASIGILCLQWIREFQHSINNASQDESLAKRQVKFRGLFTWKVPEILSVLPVLIQSALILFLIGLVDFLSSISLMMAYIVGSFVMMIIAFLFLTTALPALCHIYAAATGSACPCPYKSPQSWFFQKAVYLPLRLVVRAIEVTSSSCRSDVVRRALAGRLSNLIEAESWMNVDDMLRKFRTDAIGISQNSRVPPVSTSLAWIARTFGDSVHAIQAVYNCLLQQRVLVIRHVNAQLSGEADVRAVGGHHGKGVMEQRVTEIALLTFLNKFDGNTFMRQSPLLSQHRIELYIRAVNAYICRKERPRMAGSCSGPTLDCIPEIPEHSIEQLDMKHDVQCQLAHCLLRLIENDNIPTTSQWHLLWLIVFRQLESIALTRTHVDLYDIKVLLDDIFSTMELWMSKRLKVAAGKPGSDKRFHGWINGLYIQLASPLAISNLNGSLGGANWNAAFEMMKNQHFFGCIEIWKRDPDFSLYPSVSYSRNFWKLFADKIGLQ